MIWLKRTLLLSLTLSTPLVAQDFSGMDMPISPVQNVGLTNIGTISVLKAAENRSRGRASSGPPGFSSHASMQAQAADIPAPSPGTVAKLHFQSDRAVSEKVLQDVSRSFSGGDAAKAQTFQRSLAGDNVIGKFRSLLGKYGYSSDNVADVLTAYLVLSWEVVNNGDAMRYPSGVEALHRRIQAGLAGNSRLLAMSDAQKQSMSETFGYLAMIAAATRNELERKGDQMALAKLQDGVNSTTRKLGIDLRTVKMTEQGFVSLQ